MDGLILSNVLALRSKAPSETTEGTRLIEPVIKLYTISNVFHQLQHQSEAKVRETLRKLVHNSFRRTLQKTSWKLRRHRSLLSPLENLLCSPSHAVSHLHCRSSLVVKLRRAEAFASILQRRELCATSILKSRNSRLVLERTSSIDPELKMNAKCRAML